MAVLPSLGIWHINCSPIPLHHLWRPAICLADRGQGDVDGTGTPV